MASICFLTRYDEYFKIFSSFILESALALSKYTSSLENTLIWDLKHVHNWDFLRFILTRPSASSLSESSRRGFFLCHSLSAEFHWGYLTLCHRWSRDEGNIRRGLLYRLQGDCSYRGGGINMSDLRVFSLCPGPRHIAVFTESRKFRPRLAPRHSQPEPGPESRHSALSGGSGCHRHRSRPGAEVSGASHHPCSKTSAGSKNIMKKTTLIGKIISFCTSRLYNKIFLSALIKFLL